MSLFTWGNEPERKDVFAVRVPGLLSFLAYNRFSGEVQGIQRAPGAVRGEVRPRRLRAAGQVDLLDLPRDGRRGLADARPRRLGALSRSLRGAVRAEPLASGAPRARDRPALRRQHRGLDLHRDRPRALDRVRPDEDREGRLAQR